MKRKRNYQQAICVVCSQQKPIKIQKQQICGSCYQKERWKKRPKAKCHPNRKDHAGGLCRGCYRLGNRVSRAKCHPDRIEASRGLCSSCYNKEPDIKAKRDHARRLKRYGLTEDEYKKMIDNGYYCSICGNDTNIGIDHCHVNGHVRGFLCRECNAGIGMFRDDVDLLKKAIMYLEK